MKKRIITLTIFTVLFASFFGMFTLYTSFSQSPVVSASFTASSLQFIENQENFSKFEDKNFTGALQIKEIKTLSSFAFDKASAYRLMYHLEYPVFANAINTPIKNFLNAQLWQVQDNFLAKKEGNIWKYPEFNAHFTGYTGSGVHSIIYSLTYHRDTVLPYQKMKMFLLKDNGTYIAPQDLVLFSSADKNTFFKAVWPYLESQVSVLLPETLLLDGVENFMTYPIFAFDKKDIILFFEAGNIAPKNQGNIMVRIPYEVMKGFFSNDPKKAKDYLKNSKNINTPSSQEKRQKKYVALTFDDGPKDKTTPILLDILEQKWVKATFFVLGKNAEKFPSIIRKIHEKWHEIESHTWGHHNLMNLSTQWVRKEIEETDRVVKEIIGKPTKFVRPPYGAFNFKIQDIIGKPILMWSVDSRDWQHRNVQKNLQATLPHVKNGSIILYHDIHASSVRTIPRLIDELRLRGYEFLTVEELFKKQQHKTIEGKFVCSSGDKCEK